MKILLLLWILLADTPNLLMLRQTVSLQHQKSSQEVPPPSNTILPEQFLLHGTVTDARGAVVWHASLRITGIPEGTGPLEKAQAPNKQGLVVTAETDPRGQFSVKVHLGSYQICVSREAFTTMCQIIRAKGKQDVAVDFSLSFDPVWLKDHEPAGSEVMDDRLRKLAGKGAVTCGRVQVNDSPTNATACALRAFKQHKPFYVRYDARGIDAELADGLASDATGTTYGVIFDSFGVAPGNLRQSVTMPDGDHTIVLTCPKPAKIRITKNQKATCFKRAQKFFWAIE